MQTREMAMSPVGGIEKDGFICVLTSKLRRRLLMRQNTIDPSVDGILHDGVRFLINNGVCIIFHSRNQCTKLFVRFNMMSQETERREPRVV